jgi:hypothetical protein
MPAAGIQPALFPLGWMRLAVHLHQCRGGRVLPLFFHSSELMPGGTPHIPTEKALQRLLAKLRSFFAWLTTCYSVEGVTRAGLSGEIAAGHFACPVLSLNHNGLDAVDARGP